jgi:type I restriction enzyme S subunit
MQSDELTNEFLKAVFLEMFGDPSGNPRNWVVKKIEEVASRVQIGPFGTQLHERDYVTNGIPVINPKHIWQERISPDNRDTVSRQTQLRLSNYQLKVNSGYTFAPNHVTTEV